MGFSERKDVILGEIKRRGRVSVPELSSLLGVSQVTVRRDLQRLEREGYVVKTYGGAVSTDRVAFEFSFQKKLQRNIAEKERIGRYAAGLVEEGEAIFLDNGTTTLQIAYNLRTRRNIKVVTNSLCVVYALEPAEGIELILLGGIVRRGWNDLYGPLTEKAIAELHVDKAFVGADGVSPEAGFTAADLRTARPTELVVRSAKKVIVVADHTKIGRVAFVRFASLDDVDMLITSRGIGEEEKVELESRGLKVIVV
ncbi:MAG: DeoR/GlpR transcriptional regulator [Candidatus Latescibacterota bacterium]|nr:MAG: DeoR/GlpR transcriptional regulator [Candidatus Latescibacterota bacterium]HDI00138.1 DeoR/GlpR transcriptional regulator [Bacillota bacterium]